MVLAGYSNIPPDLSPRTFSCRHSMQSRPRMVPKPSRSRRSGNSSNSPGFQQTTSRPQLPTSVSWCRQASCTNPKSLLPPTNKTHAPLSGARLFMPLLDLTILGRVILHSKMTCGLISWDGRIRTLAYFSSWSRTQFTAERQGELCRVMRNANPTRPKPNDNNM